MALKINKPVKTKDGYSKTTGNFLKLFVARIDEDNLPVRTLHVRATSYRSEIDYDDGKTENYPIEMKEKYVITLKDQSSYEALTPQKLHEAVRDAILVDNKSWVKGDIVIDLNK